MLPAYCSSAGLGVLGDFQLYRLTRTLPGQGTAAWLGGTCASRGQQCHTKVRPCGSAPARAYPGCLLPRAQLQHTSEGAQGAWKFPVAPAETSQGPSFRGFGTSPSLFPSLGGEPAPTAPGLPAPGVVRGQVQT